MAGLRRRECTRCHAEVREGKRTHFCGAPYPLKVHDEIAVVEYVPAAEIEDLRNALRYWTGKDERTTARIGRFRMERDDARAEVERLRKLMAEKADWLERDRRESDKILCHVASLRRDAFDG